MLKSLPKILTWVQPLRYSGIPIRELEDWKLNKHINGRMECQPMDKADRRRMYAALFGWRMAAWFWISKPLHSIANPSRRKHSRYSWCSVAAFSFIRKLRETESWTEVQGHRILFLAGKTDMEECCCTGNSVPEKSLDFLGEGAVKWVIFRACTEMSDTELVTMRPQR